MPKPILSSPKSIDAMVERVAPAVLALLADGAPLAWGAAVVAVLARSSSPCLRGGRRSRR